MAKAKYKRVLLKLSGEAFKGNATYGIDAATVNHVASQIKKALLMKVQIAIVVGGGNIWRGVQAERDGVDRATADYAGMLATLINSLVLQDALEHLDVDTRTQSALAIQQVAEPFIRRRTIRHLEKGRVVILACGTGNPYMTSDTAAALRAVEIEADMLLMSKNNVDGVYSADPKFDPDAKKYDRLTYLDALNQRLGIMDSTALSLCLENKVPIIVFNLDAENSLERVIKGEPLGTLITGERQ